MAATFSSASERAKQITALQQQNYRRGQGKCFPLKEWPAIAFDVDHTLARYRLPQLHKLCYEEVVSLLKEIPDYRGIEFRPFGEIDQKFAQRGLFYDTERGVVMKLDDQGNIMKAYHGTKPLLPAELEDIYAKSELLNILKHGPFIKREEEKVEDSSIYCFDSHFMTGTIYLLMELIQMLRDGKVLNLGFKRPFKQIMRAYNKIFNPEDFRRGQFGFFSALKANPNIYLYRLSSDFIIFLRRLRRAGVAVMIITNSAPDFANFVLDFIFEQEWRSKFDAVIYNAKKPYFFHLTGRPWYTVDPSSGRQGVSIEPKNFKLPIDLCGGSMRDLKTIIKLIKGVAAHHMIYVGDSLIAETVAGSLTKKCGIMSIVEEIREEYETEWGRMLGTKGEPTFWKRKLAESSVEIFHSANDMSCIDPLLELRVRDAQIEDFWRNP